VSRCELRTSATEKSYCEKVNIFWRRPFGAEIIPATSRHLLGSHTPAWMPLAGLEEAMKLSQPRERMPLTVWIALVMLALASVAYIAGVFLFDDLLALFSEKK